MLQCAHLNLGGFIMNSISVEDSPLGKKSAYISQYDPGLLFPIPRLIKRNEINVPSPLPFKGYDHWNAYELSWLNAKGKPQVAIGELIIDCESLNIIESKSLKLYFNSFNNSRIESQETLLAMIKHDLEQALAGKLSISLFAVDDYAKKGLQKPDGQCIDDLDIAIDNFELNPAKLQIDSTCTVYECLYSNLLKSNCLVTGQPDWGSVEIRYQGPQINKESLLRYLVSYRNHNEFHEQCVERIFMDIKRFCQPEKLCVRAFYTRRGGLDINPARSTDALELVPLRTPRQ